METLLWTGGDQVTCAESSLCCHLLLLQVCVSDVLLQIESLCRLSTEVTNLDDVIILHSWLQVDLRPFRDSLLSIIHDWRQMYTEYLLDSVSDR